MAERQSCAGSEKHEPGDCESPPNHVTTCQARPIRPECVAAQRLSEFRLPARTEVVRASAPTLISPNFVSWARTDLRGSARSSEASSTRGDRGTASHLTYLASPRLDPRAHTPEEDQQAARNRPNPPNGGSGCALSGAIRPGSAGDGQCPRSTYIGRRASPRSSARSDSLAGRSHVCGAAVVLTNPRNLTCSYCFQNESSSGAVPTRTSGNVRTMP